MCLNIPPIDPKPESIRSNIFCRPPNDTKVLANSLALVAAELRASAAALPHLVQNAVSSSLPACPIKVSHTRAQPDVTWSATASDASPNVWNSEAILTNVSSLAKRSSDLINTSFVNQPSLREPRKPSDISIS